MLDTPDSKGHEAGSSQKRPRLDGLQAVHVESGVELDLRSEGKHPENRPRDRFGTASEAKVSNSLGASLQDSITISDATHPADSVPSGRCDDPGTPDLSGVPCQWSGWCEIESDPALFNTILHDWGVKGVKAYELFSLDVEMLAHIPRPIYGLIFLFRWMDHGDTEPVTAKEQYEANKIWFANQVPDNACATIALLNIMMNVDKNVEIGEHLQQFKEFTSEMSPSMRGLAIDNFQFIKDIHNSFGRKLDMLADDCELAHKAEDRKSQKRKRRRYEEEPALHFNAFLPLDSELYKLDGLDGNPCSLGPLNQDDWVLDTRATLEDRMMACGTAEHEFAVLALAQDPVFELERKSDAARETLRRVRDLIKELRPDDTAKPNPGEIPINTRELDELIRKESVDEILATKSLLDLLGYQKSLETSISKLDVEVIEGQQLNAEELNRAGSRRFDFEPAVRYWISQLASKGRLKEMLDWADKYTI